VNEKQAEALIALLNEAINRTHWQELLDYMTSEDMGYTPAELEDAYNALARIAGRDEGLL